MSKLLKKAKQEFKDEKGKYEIYNLRENPFPSTPIVNQEDQDIRYNGGIFEEKIRQEEWKKVYDNFLKVSQSNPNHLRIGYILDTSYVGRGNGKSSFCVNLLKSINEQFCLDISNEENKCFGLYVSPEPSGRTKSFYNLVDIIFENLIDNDIIDSCLATLRLEALLKIKDDFDVSQFDSDQQIVDKLNSPEWFKTNEIEVAKVAKEILKNEYLSKLSQGFPLFRDRNNFFGTTITTKEDFKIYYSNLKKGQQRIDFVFTDLVKFFLAAGFNGAYIFIDDFERIPDFQSDRQKREFALEIRTNFFDGVSTNAKLGFYNLFLILHAGVPRLVEKAWAEAGMEQRSPIITASPTSNHIIFFEKLTPQHGVLLIKRYMDEYRIKQENDKNEKSVKPFTDDAIQRIGEITEMNAAGILQKAHHALEKGAENKVGEIDSEYIKELFGEIKKVELESTDFEDEDDTVDLFKKSEED
ncbi:MAG: hypothetical protein RLN79_06935 [Cytophagales bacterium]